MASSAARNNFIGGGNLISGNAGQGVVVADTGSTGNTVAGNLIGLNAAGAARIPNGYAGISIFGGAQNNLIGGTNAAARNAISGNANQGITISDAGTNGNTIAGNYIGLAASGAASVPNSYSGVDVFGGAQANMIGGAAIGSRNWVSGNLNYGVVISGNNTNGNLLYGNTIGLDVNGGTAPNSFAGVALFGGAKNNLLGGPGSGAGNLIAGNTSSRGIAIYDAATSGNTVSGNSIYNDGNAPLLYSSAPTSAAPTLNSAVLNLNTAISGALTAAASATFRIEYFASPPGTVGGKVYLGGANTTTGSSNFSATFAARVPAGSLVTAVAINSANDSSTFSNSVTVSATDTDSDGLPDAYETANGLSPTQPGDAALDSDGDGLSNLQEFFAGTDPKDARKRLAITAADTSAGNLQLTFPTVTGALYQLQAAGSLSSPTAWHVLSDNLLGTGAALSITIPGPFPSPQFYRIAVEP